MVERLRSVPDQFTVPLSEANSSQSADLTPFHLLALPAIEILTGQVRLEAVYASALRRLERLSQQLPKSPPEPDGAAFAQAPPSKLRPFSADDILPTARQLIERLANPPLLPAPPSFEAAFSPYEPMFHTVFYRRYPYERLDDAKQNALVHLWKRWKTDMTLLEQSAAYVVQAAIWGASPHRKIKREQRIQAHELPMLEYERTIDVRVTDQSRDPAWVHRIDRSVDVQSAIATMTHTLRSQPQAETLLPVLDDILNGRTLKEGRQQRSCLSFRGYKQARDAITEQLRVLLADYAPE